MKKLFLFIFIILAGTAYAQQPTRGALSTLDTTINKPTIKMLAVNVLDNAVVFWNLSYWATIESGSSSGVTSVGLSVPSVGSPFLGVSGSPVTTSGTLALSALGTNSQIVLGDGSLGSALPTAIIPTWQQTLTSGSTLTQDNSIILSGFDLEFQGNSSTSFNILGVNSFGINDFNGTRISASQTETQLISPFSSGRSSVIDINTDSLWIKPSLGNFIIDTINNETFQNVLMGWTSSGVNRGKVGYITIAGSLSLSSGVLTGTGITGLTVGTTTIASGTTTRILYDNAGVLGEYTITGSGTVVAMQTSPSFVTSVIGGASFDAFNTVSTTLNFGGAATTMTIGGTPTTAITHNYSTNATAAATTKTINFGTGGAASSTTNVNIASVIGGTTALNSPIITIGGGTTASDLRFFEGSGGGTNYVGFKANATLAGNTIYTLPTAFPAGTYLLNSTSAGVMGFTDPSTFLTALTNGNGTTANGTAVDLGGTMNANIDIDDDSPDNHSLQIGKNTNLSLIQLRASALQFNLGTVQMDFYGAGAATFDASGNISSVSDERLKNIQGDYEVGLKQVMKINPIVYKWKPESYMETKHDYVGFSAQNIKSALGDNAIGVNKDGYFSIQDRAILAVLVNAVKEQQKEIDQLKKQLKNK